MVGQNQVTITLAGDADQLQRALRKAAGSLNDLDRKVDSTGGRLRTFGANLTSSSNKLAAGLMKVGKVAVLGFGAAGVAAAAFGMSAVRAAEESAKVSAQTGAVIESMGLSARVTADEIGALAERLSRVTAVDDELIQSGSNVLLTFRSVAQSAGETGGVFDRATAAALDMSVALGQDMNSAAMLVGKALNDPVRALGALRRVGIQFTAAQEDQIRAMVEAGNVAGAQAILLGELEAQFGGSAEAQATASDRMKLAWENLQEAIGEKLLPVFEDLSDWVLNTGIPALEDLSDWFAREGVPRLRDFGQWLQRNLLPALAAVGGFLTDTLVPALVDLGEWFVEHERVLAATAIGIATLLVPAFVAWAAAAIAAAAATIAAMAPLILIGAVVGAIAYLIITHWETIKNATIVAFNAVTGAIAAAFNWVKTNWPLLLAILTGPIGLAVLAIVRHWDTIKRGITSVKDWIVGTWNTVVGFVAGIPGRIGRAAAGMWDGIKNSFKSAINAIIGWWNDLRFPSFDIPSVDPLGSFGPSIGGGTIGGWSLPDITPLATGGVVKRPTLAMIGEAGPEAVVPLGSSGVGMTLNVYVQGSIRSDRDLVRLIRDEIDRGGLGGFR